MGREKKTETGFLFSEFFFVSCWMNVCVCLCVCNKHQESSLGCTVISPTPGVSPSRGEMKCLDSNTN